MSQSEKPKTERPQAGRPPEQGAMLALSVNGADAEVPDVGESLLAVLRDRLGLTSVKDGCSPQGQCGCCTVLVDGKPRVACVTPARRVRGREVTTLEGMDGDRRQRWGDAFCAAGGSQCGFCTPGIIMRLDPLTRDRDGGDSAHGADGGHGAVDQALLAHLCRCTGWQTIHEAWDTFLGNPDAEPRDTAGPTGRPRDTAGPTGRPRDTAGPTGRPRDTAGPTGRPRDTAGPTGRPRDTTAAEQRAAIEGHSRQRVSADVALGRGGFAADTAPSGALIAVSAGPDSWSVGETLTEARAEAGKVQGRRTTAGVHHPLELPSGPWAATLRTTWTDGAYLETDASWCEPGGQPSSVVANGGAFGAKTDDQVHGREPTDRAALNVRGAARRLADEHQRPVLVLASREDVARYSPKRPPVAAGMNSDGTGVMRVVATPGIEEAVLAVAPGLTVEQVPVAGPPTSSTVRAAGWAEAVVLQAGARGRSAPVRAPSGAVVEAEVDADTISVLVECGPVLDATVLRSFCIGAAHMAWSWLTSEAMVVDADGTVHDLTVRSFGVVRAVDTPQIEVEFGAGRGEPVNGSDAVFAAVAAAGWLANDCRPDWPIGR